MFFPFSYPFSRALSCFMWFTFWKFFLFLSTVACKVYSATGCFTFKHISWCVRSLRQQTPHVIRDQDRNQLKVSGWKIVATCCCAWQLLLALSKLFWKFRDGGNCPVCPFACGPGRSTRTGFSNELYHITYVKDNLSHQPFRIFKRKHMCCCYLRN